MHPMSFSISPPSQLLSLRFFSSPPSQLLPPFSQGAAEALPAPGAGLGQIPPYRKGSSSLPAQLHPSSSLLPQGFLDPFPFSPALAAAPLAHSKSFSIACLSHKYSKPSLYLLRSDEGNQSLGSGKQNLGMTFSLSSVSFDGLKGCSGWRGNRCI